MTRYAQTLLLPALGAAALLFTLSAVGGRAQTQNVADDVKCSPIHCVNARDIAPGAVDATKIRNGTIGPNKLIPGSMNRFTIATDAIRSNKILDGAVQSADIADDTITAIDIFDEARADFAGSSTTQLFALTSANQTARSVAITAPTSGFAVVNASGFFLRNTADGFATCIITTRTDQAESGFRFLGSVSTTGTRDAFAGTRGFVVPSGTTTFNLVCSTGTDVLLVNSIMTAIWVPTRG